MKIKNVIIIGAALLMSCESKQEVQGDIDQLRKQRENLQTEITGFNYSITSKTEEVAALNEKLKELKLIESGKIPKYVLKLHLKQSHFSLSIKKHIKDAMNALDFEMPVDKEFYNSVSIGTQIVDNFRVGSLILYGSIGDWEMSVKGKEIR